MQSPRTFALVVLTFIATLGCAAERDAPAASQPTASQPTASQPTVSQPTVLQPTVLPEPEPVALPDPSSALPGLWEITEGPGAPFLLSPPTEHDRSAPVVLFIPGGAGIRDHAVPTFQRWLAQGRGRDRVWLLVPYSVDGDLSDEEARVQSALQRVLAERASDASAVHLAGTSNGGRTAFRWMLEHPDRYQSFLGAPALPARDTEDERLVSALDGKRVLLAVGEQDGGPGGWLGATRALGERLTELGVDHELSVLPGEGHILSEGFDETLFFDFWLARR